MIKSLQIKALFWLAVATWALILFTSGIPLDQALMKPAGLSLGVVTATVAFFERYGWRWKIFRPWLVATPDLNGTYKGTVESFWKDPETGLLPDPIGAYVSIHQTLSGIVVRLFTKGSASVSLVASLYDSPDGQWELVYTYRNEPEIRLRNGNPIHYGGARMTLDGKGMSRLRGNYWTDRQTFGAMNLEQVSRTRSSSFREATENSGPPSTGS